MPDLTILSPSEQVAAHLRGELMRGRWAETMPGGPKLAAELGIDKKTVEAALGLLEEEHLLIPQGPGHPAHRPDHRRAVSLSCGQGAPHAEGSDRPEHVSLICSEPDPTFAWLTPSVAHMSHDLNPPG